jgi:nucleotide-binding universal stress UspA family protein
VSRCLVVGYEATAAGDRAIRWAEERSGPDDRIVVVAVDEAPVDAILQAAVEADADAIVVGTRHRRRPNTGSVCSALFARSDRPVVVVP